MSFGPFSCVVTKAPCAQSAMREGPGQACARRNFCEQSGSLRPWSRRGTQSRIEQIDTLEVDGITLAGGKQCRLERGDHWAQVTVSIEITRARERNGRAHSEA